MAPSFIGKAAKSHDVSCLAARWVIETRWAIHFHCEAVACHQFPCSITDSYLHAPFNHPYLLVDFDVACACVIADALSRWELDFYELQRRPCRRRKVTSHVASYWILPNDLVAQG